MDFSWKSKWRSIASSLIVVVRVGKRGRGKSGTVIVEESDGAYIRFTFSRKGLWELWGIVHCRDAERSGITVVWREL